VEEVRRREDWARARDEVCGQGLKGPKALDIKPKPRQCHHPEANERSATQGEGEGLRKRRAAGCQPGSGNGNSNGNRNGIMGRGRGRGRKGGRG
jgi:hypothetical protein